MLKIRLRRMGSRHRPFYRVVVSDSRRTPTAAALDEVGYYDPRRSPSLFKVDMDKVDHWLARGAQPSETVSKLVSKARKGAFDGAEEAPAEKPAAKKAEAPAEKAEAPADDAEVKEADVKAEAPAEEAEAPAAEAETTDAKEEA